MLLNKDPSQIVIIEGNDKTKDVEKLEISSSFVRIKFLRNPKIYTYNSDKIVIKNNYCASKDTQIIMNYFAKEAECSPIKIDENSDTLLKKYIDNITEIADDIVLSYYIHKKTIIPNKFNTASLIYPFGLNTSQKQAVENAFLYPISIVQGPPGTGKTQTILNIIANAILQNKSIAIASNNNSAIVNIAEKLKKHNLDFLLAMLGSKQNREEFVINQCDYPDINDFKLDERTISLQRQISQSIIEIKENLKKQNELFLLKQSKDGFITEQKYFLQNNETIFSNKHFERLLLKFSSKKLFNIWTYCLNTHGNCKTLRDFLYFLSKFGLSFLFLKDKNIANLTNLLQKLYYEKKISEIENKITKLNNFLKTHALQAQMEHMTRLSFKRLKAFLYKKFRNKKRSKFSLQDTSHLSNEFIKEYPIVLSTLFSLKNICKSNFVFDYLVVDEASQADLLTSVIAMSCAKNIVIVGDIKQLPNVITKEIQKNSEKILQNYPVDDVYKLHKHSLLSSFLTLYPEIPNVLLREHYRCHPKIIGFCNTKYYQNELILYTQNDDTSDTLKAIKTALGNHARGHINQRQIDIIKKEILPYMNENMSIGIITPYRDQVNELRSTFSKNIEIDTIHKFQGREKDIIILSTVDNNITNFIDNPNLLNVAVSRAVKKFWIVYSNENEKMSSNLVDLINYIKYNNFEVVQSKVHSIFDLLYKHYTVERIKFLNKHPHISRYASENIAYACIISCIKQLGNNSLDVVYGFPLKQLININNSYTEEEINFIFRDSHIDFLIYNKIDKKPILAIEVDGGQHLEVQQKRRDELKNNILKKAGLELLRLKTHGSGERERIINKLLELGISQDTQNFKI